METWQNLVQTWHSDPQVHLLGSLTMLFLAAVLVHILIKQVILRILRKIAPRFGEVPSEILRDKALANRVALFMPLLVIYQGSTLLPELTSLSLRLVQKMTIIVTLGVGLSLIVRLMATANDIYTRYPVSRTRPIKGYLQIVTILLYAIVFVLAIATLLDKSPLVFVSGLGAMTAILLLVFRDTLLSLVAGIQLTSNKLIQVGDWIEIPQFGADGDVIDIALHTVKVQNWDKTITTIPTHKFLEHSFKNWRGMSESGGRRIKRSLCLDLNSIRFISDAEKSKFADYALLKEYFEQRQAEIAAHNAGRSDTDILRHNARRMTNVGVFRAYLVSYLRQKPEIRQDMSFLVRQLQPTAEGLPIEIYVFASDTRWAHYENIQADIFDHIFAVVREFGLTVYQKPSGADFRLLRESFQP